MHTSVVAFLAEALIGDCELLEFKLDGSIAAIVVGMFFGKLVFELGDLGELSKELVDALSGFRVLGLKFSARGQSLGL